MKMLQKCYEETASVESKINYAKLSNIRRVVSGVDLTGLLGGHKKTRGLGTEVKSPRSLSVFVKLHIIFALKYNKQQLLLLLDKINLA